MADSSEEGPFCPGWPLEHDFWLFRLCWARLSVQSFFLTALRCLYVGGGFSEYYRNPQCLHISQVCHFSISLTGLRHYSGIFTFFFHVSFQFFSWPRSSSRFCGIIPSWSQNSRRIAHPDHDDHQLSRPFPVFIQTMIRRSIVSLRRFRSLRASEAYLRKMPGTEPHGWIFLKRWEQWPIVAITGGTDVVRCKCVFALHDGDQLSI